MLVVSVQPTVIAWLFKRSISAQSEDWLSVSPLTDAAVTFGRQRWIWVSSEERGEWAHTE